MALKTKKRTRTMFLKVMENIVDTELPVLITDFKQENFVALTTMKNVLEMKLEKYMELSEQIGERIENGQQYEIDMNEVVKNEVRFKTKLTKIAEILKKANKETSLETVVPKKPSVPLPKIQIKQFSGNPTEWQSFQESFDEPIHKNNSLSGVEKMNYLLSLLSGEAALCVKGLKLSNENYDNVREMLCKRFGNRQQLISAHMENLLKLESVENDNDTKALRTLYDIVETQVRSLNSLECLSENYGHMLIPVLMSKLPSEFRLIMSRKLTSPVLKIADVLSCLQSEIEAREKVTIANDLCENEFFTAHGLHTQSKQQKHPDKYKGAENHTEGPTETPLCLFCRRSHSSKSCDFITKPEARKLILMKEKRCFVCMKMGDSTKL